MNLSILVIIVTLLVGIADKMSNKPLSERKGIFKKLKLVNVTILLLGVLFFIQIADSHKASQKEKKQESQSTEAYEKIATTHEKVSDANRLIDSALRNLNNELLYTQEEFKLISELNRDMADVRGSIRKSLSEYKNLNSQYKKQLAFEKEKIENDKPDVRAIFAKSMIDSLSINYQFQLLNYGKRVADSVEFYATMILLNADKSIFKATTLKTNRYNHNTLSLPAEEAQGYIANGEGFKKKDAYLYKSGYLIVRYKYYDKMTNTHVNPEPMIFACSSFTRENAQYSLNADSSKIDIVKKILSLVNKDYHEILFE
jgi:hypothetical protein